MKIGIIGGGAAGLMAAWLLEADHDVTLFECEDRLGGHINTVHIPIKDQMVPIESGFEFFSEPLFPVLCHLLKILEIEVREYPLTYTFYSEKQTLVLPPFSEQRISWGALTPNSLCKLIQFNYFLTAGEKIVETGDTSITMEEFARKTRVSSKFKEDFLYPFYAGAWGAEIEDLKAFAAYDVLYWSLEHKPARMVPTKWLEIVGGACSYIHELAKKLNTTHVTLSKTITALTFDGNGYGIVGDDKIVHVDYLVIATNALEAKKLLRTLPHTREQQAALDNIDYFHTLIAVHGDEQKMPKDKRNWSIANIYYDGEKSSLTVCKPRSLSTDRPEERTNARTDAEMQDQLPGAGEVPSSRRRGKRGVGSEP